MELLYKRSFGLIAARDNLPTKPPADITSSSFSLAQGAALGRVRLQPEYFELDWLHGHEMGRPEERHELRKDASFLLTSLLQKAQRNRKLSCLIPDPGPPKSGGQKTSLKARLTRYLTFRRQSDPKRAV